MTTLRSGWGAAGVFFGSGCLFVFGLLVFAIAAGIGAAVLSAMHGAVGVGLLALVIVLVFAAAGLGLMALAWRAPGKAREQRQREARYPGQPWLWREDWEQGFARAEGRSHAAFRLTSGTGVLGGKLRGSIDTGGAASTGEMQLVLSCLLWSHAYRYSTSEVLWEEHATAGPGAAVDFDIPFDARASEDTGPGYNDRVFWRLSARSADGGFHACFSVPVFQTADSDPSRTRERLESRAATSLGGYAPAEGRIAKAVTPEGIRYLFPRGRNRSIAAMVTVFALVFLGIAVAIGLSLLGGLSLGAIVGILFVGAFGLILLLVSVWLWFAETTVTAATGELRIHTTCLGMSHTRTLHAEEIRGFDIKPGMQKGNEVWYDVWLRVPSGRDTNAGTGMDKTEAEWFVAELRKDLGVK
jgi:hypothetical protein